MHGTETSSTLERRTGLGACAARWRSTASSGVSAACCSARSSSMRTGPGSCGRSPRRAARCCASPALSCEAQRSLLLQFHEGCLPHCCASAALSCEAQRGALLNFYETVLVLQRTRSQPRPDTAVLIQL